MKHIRTIASEVRAISGGEEKLTIGGLAVPYGKMTTLYSDEDFELREIIDSGAFAESLTERDQHCLWQHDSKVVLGRKGIGTLRLTESEGSVDFECDCPESSEGRSKYITIQRGDVNQVSFGFDDREVVEERATIDGKRVFTRTVKKADLWEVSPVTWAAYGSDTNVSARDGQGITDIVKRAKEAFDSGAPEDDNGSADLVQRTLATRDAELFLIKEL